MQLRLYIAMIIPLLLAASLASVDDASVRGVGGSVELIHPEHSSVRMVRESVEVRLEKQNLHIRHTEPFG